MAKHYLVENIENLRQKINREFLIRLQPEKGKSQLVGFTRLCLLVGDLHAEHYCKKGIGKQGRCPGVQKQGFDRPGGFLSTLMLCHDRRQRNSVSLKF